MLPASTGHAPRSYLPFPLRSCLPTPLTFPPRFVRACLVVSSPLPPIVPKKINAMHSANALATAFVPRLRQHALLFVTALVCLFTGSLHAQTALKQINAGGAAVAPFA